MILSIAQNASENSTQEARLGILEHFLTQIDFSLNCNKADGVYGLRFHF